jgi:rhamnosyltransferase
VIDARSESIVPRSENTCAVIVSFNPAPDLIDHIAAVRDQVAQIILVDNGSASASVVDAAARMDGVAVLRNPDNRGMATGLNQGSEHAMDLGAQWILTLDQDTRPLPTLITAARTAYVPHPQRQLVGAIGANSTFGPRPAGCVGRDWIPAEWVITAGCLCSAVALKRAGGFDESFFIDFVDVEFGLRLRKLGYQVIQACKPGMDHRPGQAVARRFLGRQVHPSHHPPQRWYYITRNRIRVWRRYAATYPGFVVGDVMQSVRDVLKIMIFEDARLPMLRWIARGAMDALRRRVGPI